MGGHRPPDRPDAKKGLFAKMGDAINRAASEAEDRKEANTATYGAVVKKGMFGVKTVEIYETGYVRVGVILTGKSPYEKLKSIKFTQQVQDRSAAGHLWSSGGMGSRDKRVLLLTIATDRQVHTLSTEGQMGRTEDKLGLALEAAGNSVISGAAPAPTVITHAAPEITAADKLRQIADLHRDGVLSDEEFAAAKGKLLGQL